MKLRNKLGEALTPPPIKRSVLILFLIIPAPLHRRDAQVNGTALLLAQPHSHVNTPLSDDYTLAKSPALSYA